jgi:hypothetical protein
VAQLGARFHGMEEVESSNLSRSTKLQKILEPRFSYSHMQVVRAGGLTDLCAFLSHAYSGVIRKTSFGSIRLNFIEKLLPS